MQWRACWVGLGVVTGMLSTTLAFGQTQPRDPLAAEALFRQGLDALKRDDWVVACKKFEKSLELEPAVSTQFKLAKCREHENKLASAWYAYELALKMNRESQASERRRSELEGAIVNAISALKPRVPTLRMVVNPMPEGLVIARDGEPFASTLLGETIPIDPGQHEIIVRAPTYQDYRQKLDVPAGRAVELVVELVAERTKESAVTPVKPSPPVAIVPETKSIVRSPTVAERPVSNSTHSESFVWNQRHTGLAFTAVGVVSLGIASYYGVKTLQKVSEMDDYKRDDGSYERGVMGPHDEAVKNQRVGLVLACAGTAFSSLGLTLYLTAKRGNEERPQANHSTLALHLSPVGIQAEGGF